MTGLSAAELITSLHLDTIGRNPTIKSARPQGRKQTMHCALPAVTETPNLYPYQFPRNKFSGTNQPFGPLLHKYCEPHNKLPSAAFFHVFAARREEVRPHRDIAPRAGLSIPFQE
jgi:hypothetical protein